MKREGKAGSQYPAGGMAGTQDRGSHPTADGRGEDAVGTCSTGD